MALAIAGAAAVALAPADLAAAATRCGNGPSQGRENLIVDVRATGTSCRIARRVAARYRDGDSTASLGYRCIARRGEAESRVRCRKGERKLVTFTVILF